VFVTPVASHPLRVGLCGRWSEDVTILAQ
jgi:hypothetical protein